ncbi:50S ribosomal protein L37ae [Candidatus Woesearchaeota archaeon]|nr:50S ribosomal protein L37ae [Candidatus Woesearchaeota archaeon]
MAETKEKIGSIRRFGARYGRTPRLRFGKIEQEQRKHHKCPYCMNVTVKRLSAGIWECKKCNAKFTGKAYTIGKRRKVVGVTEEEATIISEEDKLQTGEEMLTSDENLISSEEDKDN